MEYTSPITATILIGVIIDQATPKIDFLYLLNVSLKTNISKIYLLLFKLSKY